MSGTSIDLGTVYASVAINLQPVQEGLAAFGAQIEGVQTLVGGFVESLQALGMTFDQVTEPTAALDEALGTGSEALQAFATAAGEADAALSTVGGAAAEAGAGVDAASGEIDANTAALDANAEAADANAASHKAAGEASTGLGDSMGKLVAPLAIAEAAIVGVAAVAVKMSSDFRASMTQLVTGAGESQKNLKMVSDGILAMASQTGESTTQLAQAMFTIESAGDHGAAGLTILRDAAESSRESGAQLADTANALTTVLANYGAQGVTAANATNVLLGIVSNGKTTMQDLASSISTVLPAAAKYGVSLTDVGGALATMTAQNGDAASSTTYLRQLLTSLASPSSAAQKALKAIGLSAQQVSDDMKKSLPDTLQLITDRINATFPPGSVAATTAFKNIAGGSKQMQGMLLLTGQSMGTFKQNVLNVSDVVKQGGNTIAGWSLTQKDLSTQLAQAGAAAQVALIQVGTALEPIVKQVLANIMPALKQFGDWASTHGPEIAKAFAFVAGVVGVALVGALAGAAATFLIAQAAAIGIVAALALVGAGVALVIMHWKQIKDFFTSTSPAALAVKAALVALGGALAGFAVYAIAEAIPAIMTSVTAFGAQAVAAGAAAIATLAAAAPFILIGAAIALVVAGIYELITHWSQVSAFLEGVWAATVKGVGAGFHWLAGEAGLLWSEIVARFDAGVAFVKGLVKAGFDLIKSIIFGDITAIVDIFDWLYQHNTYFADLVNAIKADFLEAKTIIITVWNDVVGFLTAAWDSIKAGAQFAFDLVKGIIVGEFDFYKNIIITVGSFIVGFLKSAWATIRTDVVDAWNAVTSFIGGLASRIGAAITSGVIQPLMGPITALIAGAEAWGQNLIKMFIKGIQSMASAAGNAASGIAKNVASFLGFHSPAEQGPGADADTWAPNLVKMFTGGLAAGTGDAARAAATLMSGVAGVLGAGVSAPGLALGGGVAQSAAASLIAPTATAQAVAAATSGVSGARSYPLGDVGSSLASSPLGQASNANAGGGDVHIYGLTVEVVAAPSDGQPYQAGVAFGNGFAAAFQQARTQRGL